MKVGDRVLICATQPAVVILQTGMCRFCTNVSTWLVRTTSNRRNYNAVKCERVLFPEGEVSDPTYGGVPCPRDGHRCRKLSCWDGGLCRPNEGPP